MDAVNSLKHPARQAKLMAAFKEVANSGRYTEGAYTFNLEKKLSTLLGGQHAVTFNSDASAWYALYRYLTIQGKNTVAICNNTYYATGSMALQAGMKLYLVDCLPDHPSMSPESLKEILKGVQVVVITHVGGWLAQSYYEIAELCHSESKVLLEDCTDVLGLDAIQGRLGEAAVWSFYPSKSVPAGEGGVLTTRSHELRDFARLYRQCGKHLQGGTLHYSRGMNLKISEWDAAVACTQLEALPEILAARKRDYEALQLVAPPLLHGPSNYYKYIVDADLVTGWKTAPQIYSPTDQLYACLSNKRIETVNLVNSYRWAKRHQCLPLGEGLYDGMSKEQIEDLFYSKEKVK